MRDHRRLHRVVHRSALGAELALVLALAGCETASTPVDSPREAPVSGTSREPASRDLPPTDTVPERPIARSIPIEYDANGGLFVDALVEGRGPMRFILDTGASHGAISRTLASELGLAVVAGGEVEGTAGTVAADATTAMVEVEGLAPARVPFTVYDFASYDPRCVGILGYDVLCRAPFQIRYRERVLVWDAEPPRATVAMALDARIPSIDATLNGVSVRVRIDTGAALAPSATAYFNLTEDRARDVGLAGRPEAVFTASGTGGATLELPVHRLRSADVAGVALEDARAIVQPRVGYFARTDAIGFIGNSVLDKLDPYFDYARGRFGIGR